MKIAVSQTALVTPRGLIYLPLRMVATQKFLGGGGDGTALARAYPILCPLDLRFADEYLDIVTDFLHAVELASDQYL